MMEKQTIFEQHNIQAEELFEKAVSKEFFGCHLFETSEQKYYIFSPSEQGHAAWLGSDIDAMLVELSSQHSTPRAYSGETIQ